MIATLTGDSIALHYQPLADIKGRVISFEALMRWHHQCRSPVSPEAFIPIFEKSGLIVPLSRWALRKACLDASRWKRPLEVSISLSAFHFDEDNLPGLVDRALGEAGLAPERLELEITQASLLTNSMGALAALLKLSAMGVRIALDDAGLLPLSALQDYPFTKIKITGDIVSKIEVSASARSIIHMIVLVGHSMEMAIAAKGVATVGQLAYIRSASRAFIRST